MATPTGVAAGRLHSTASGKAILAFLPDEEAEGLLSDLYLVASTGTTIVTVEALREELRRTRDRGYAVDDMENVPGLRCIAVPVFGPSERVLGAVSVSAPALRFTEEVIRQLVPVIIEASLDISRSMGADERTLLALVSAGTAKLAG
jgi:DNA-binding IclR family transcriptional regulator